MIVDLVRNDLGRVCRYGSVAVSELCRAEEHPGVWHLVSDVTGELSEGVADAELLRATFPPGSVTGAPKVRAMELVSSLETTAREVYTGAIGIASPLSGLELNVAIRTFEIASGRVWLGVGGGVVADSDPDRELEECFDKARPLLAAVGSELGSWPGRPPSDAARAAGARPAPRTGQPGGGQPGGGPPGGGQPGAGPPGAGPPGAAQPDRYPDPGAGVFETLLVVGGRPVDLESHLGRLAASVACLYGSQPPASLGTEVTELAAARPGAQRLRVHVWPSSGGALGTELDASPAPEAFSGVPGRPVTLVPVVLPGGLGRHKWHDRRILLDLRGELCLDTSEQLLLVDTDGAVLETERANVFAVFGTVVRTPPDDGRILAGTTREVVIRAAELAGLEVSVEPLALCDLGSADEVFLTSAISGLTTVAALRGNRSSGSGPVGRRLAQALCSSWRLRGLRRGSDRYAPASEPVGGRGR